MSSDATPQTLKEVSQIAALAGIQGQVDEESGHFKMFFELEGHRTQVVYVRASAKTPSGQQVVTFFSPCLIAQKGLFAGFSKDQAIDLLTRNEKTLFARFGIWESGQQVMVVASVDHILETLDAEECAMSAWSVAITADGYEQEHGQDKF